jgi:hypothetical protein
MIGARVVLIDGLLHETQAKHAGVEIQVLARIGGDGGDVVEAEEIHGVVLSKAGL